MKKLEFGDKPKFKWSYSKLRLFQFCPVAYYLQYIKKPAPKIQTTSRFAMGSFLHRKAETFYKREFKSEETYGDAMRGQWLHLTKDNMLYGQEIKWNSDNERFILANNVKSISKIFYIKYKDEPQPLSTEYKFNFILDHREFTGEIDEIRQNYTIRDHKTDKEPPSQATLDNDLQFTFYALAFCCLSKLDREFALKHDVSEEDIKTFGGDPYYISDKVTIEYHHMRTGNIITTKRTDDHLEKLLLILDDTEDEIKKKIFMPNLTNCRSCLYDEVCDREIHEESQSQSQYSLRLPPQLYLITPPKQIEKQKPQNLKIKFPRKRKII